MGIKARRYLSYALINGELKAFVYSDTIRNIINKGEKDELAIKFFRPSENVGLVVLMKTKDIQTETKGIVKLSDPDVEIVLDDRFVIGQDKFPFKEMEKFNLAVVYEGLKETWKDRPSGIEGKTLGQIWYTPLGS